MAPLLVDKYGDMLGVLITSQIEQLVSAVFFTRSSFMNREAKELMRASAFSIDVKWDLRKRDIRIYYLHQSDSGLMFDEDIFENSRRVVQEHDPMDEILRSDNQGKMSDSIGQKNKEKVLPERFQIVFLMFGLIGVIMSCLLDWILFDWERDGFTRFHLVLTFT